jgi:hypothetical protein
MKNKLIALLATIGLVSSASAIEINDNLSINGFIDGSYQSIDSNIVGGDASSAGLDEIELNILANVGNVSGAIHLDTDGDTGLNENDHLFNIEQAHFTYSLDNGVSFTFGRYGSALGFEREDPAGLYTFSRAYDGLAYDLGNVDAASVEGLTISYAGEGFSVAASFEEAAGANLETADLNVELFASYTGIENVAIGVGYFIDNANDGVAVENDIFNINASYSFGKGLVAAEYTEIDGDGVATAGETAFMLLADYDFNDKLGAAIRYSEAEVTSTTDYNKITIAPNYAITDSLGVILEYSEYEIEGGVEADAVAVELTYTF